MVLQKYSRETEIGTAIMRLSGSPGKILKTCMLKLIFSKSEDMTKTVTFLENNFSTVIYEGFCDYLTIVRAHRTLRYFLAHTSGSNCI